MKVGFQLLTDTEALWVRVLKAKYNVTDSLPVSIRRSSCSRLWSGLASVWDAISDSVSWSIGDGSQASFWFDNWLGRNGRLVFDCLAPTVSLSVMVRDMTTSSGDWDWSRLDSLLPSVILDQIVAVPPPNGDFSPNTLGWRWNDNREFSTSSAYDFLMNYGLHPLDAAWKHIWSLEVPQRVRVFLWITLHQRHLTNAERFRRHLAPSVVCSICSLGVEDMDHVLHHCSMARNIWPRVVPPSMLDEFLHRPFITWLRDNLLYQHSNQLLAEGWSCRFAILCWLLWKDRCNAIFNPIESNRDDPLIRGSILMDECLHAFATRSLEIEVGKAAVVGVFRDAHGSWLGGFARNIGRCSVLLAELWVVHDCLSRAWSLNFRRLVLETDCMDVIRLIKSPSTSRVGNNLIELILNCTRKDWQLVFRHVPRSLNRITDSLAALGRLSTREGVNLSVPPTGLLALVEEESESDVAAHLGAHTWGSANSVACFNMHVDFGV
ncbi:hypothetical protein GQ457_14G017740 [Hibiscus cannabinus]